jgi:hypothetical protein
MITRKISDQDKPMIDGLFRSHGGGWQIPPDEILPDRGFVSENGGKPVFAGWLYIDPTSKMAFMDWLVANHDCTQEEREEGLKALLQGIWEEARAHGVQRILTISNHGGLISKLMSNGFFITDKNVTILMRDK